MHPAGSLERYDTTAWRQPALSTPSQLGAIGEAAQAVLAALGEPTRSDAFQEFGQQ